MTLDDARLAAIGARAAAAFPPPWRAGTVDAQGKVWAHDPEAFGGPSMGERCLFNANLHYDHTANREFIAHAREDVPDLVAEVRRLRALLADLADFLGVPAAAMGADVKDAAEARARIYRRARRAQWTALTPADIAAAEDAARGADGVVDPFALCVALSGAKGLARAQREKSEGSDGR